MATLTDEDMAFVRNAISEPNDSTGWTDDRINDMAAQAVGPGGTVNLRLLSGLIWEAKAGALVNAVDVNESGSSRSMSQAFTHALSMAKRFGADASAPVVAPPADPRPRSTRMIRPTRG